MHLDRRQGGLAQSSAIWRARRADVRDCILKGVNDQDRDRQRIDVATGVRNAGKILVAKLWAREGPPVKAQKGIFAGHSTRPKAKVSTHIGSDFELGNFHCMGCLVLIFRRDCQRFLKQTAMPEIRCGEQVISALAPAVP